MANMLKFGGRSQNRTADRLIKSQSHPSQIIIVSQYIVKDSLSQYIAHIVGLTGYFISISISFLGQISTPFHGVYYQPLRTRHQAGTFPDRELSL